MEVPLELFILRVTFLTILAEDLSSVGLFQKELTYSGVQTLSIKGAIEQLLRRLVSCLCIKRFLRLDSSGTVLESVKGYVDMNANVLYR